VKTLMHDGLFHYLDLNEDIALIADRAAGLLVIQFDSLASQPIGTLFKWSDSRFGIKEMALFCWVMADDQKCGLQVAGRYVHQSG